MKLTEKEEADLRSVYGLILSSPELLISLAAQRGVSIREAYSQIIEEVREK